MQKEPAQLFFIKPMATSTPKADAISYARGRFGGGSGEIHIYDDAGKNIVEKIPIDDRIKYPHS